MLHGAVLLFGVAGLFAKWIALPALLIVWGRVLFATAALALLLLAQGRPLGVRTRGQRLRLGACGLLLVAHWWAFFHAIQVSTVAVGLLAYATAPVLVVWLEPWWFAERFSRGALAAALASLAGVALMVPRWDWADATARGVAWGVVAGLTFAVLSLLNRELVQSEDGVRLALAQDAVAAALLTPLALALGIVPTLRELALLALLGVVCTALAHSWYIQSMRGLPARVAAIVSNLEPLYGIVLALLLLGEVPQPRVLLGGALILAGAGWVTWRARRAAAPDTPGSSAV
ncbi:MAG: DMT family transporter [Candidatus Lambdaproteobacteria bacterium]|nr:DMT family transporter [Candidatus Lambdaproteobacteria bacterium]